MQYLVEVKEVKSNTRKRPTRHHVIARCMRNYFNVEHHSNFTTLEERKHRAFHQFFGDNLCPQDQLKQLLSVHDSVLSHKARELYQELIELDEDEFYRYDIIKKRHGNRFGKEYIVCSQYSILVA